MAVLYITEYASIAQDSGGQPILVEPNNTEQHVAIGASSAQSATLQNNTRYVRLQADAVCSIAFGSNPTAVATSHRLPANTVEIVAVPINSAFKIANITNT